jgi:hypothetical protein
MKDFFENKKDNKEMLEWCEKNIFNDARDYISRRSVVDYTKKSNSEVFLSLSITTWILIINNKINEEDFPLFKREGKEEAMRSIIFFLLKLNEQLKKTSKINS